MLKASQHRPQRAALEVVCHDSCVHVTSPRPAHNAKGRSGIWIDCGFALPTRNSSST